MRHKSSIQNLGGFKPSVKFGKNYYLPYVFGASCFNFHSTVSYISLLDCAFFFYQNYPCRVSRSEMEYELPSEDSFFQSEHPFSEPLFSLTRGATVYMAFQMLFRSPSVDCPQASPGINHMHFTVLHMFILIHGM